MVYFFFFSAKKDLSQLWSALESIRDEVTYDEIIMQKKHLKIQNSKKLLNQLSN